MTTRDFIKNTYNVASEKPRQCSSVFTDYNGQVYSYGYHYPLAFNIAGLDFVNTRGYSSTTAKHIAWAKDALNYQHLSVELDRADAQAISSSWNTKAQKLETIIKALTRQLNEIHEVMATKKRKNTWVYTDLQAQADRVSKALEAVKAVA